MEEKKIDIINGPLLKGILSFAWPIMVANILQITFNFADTLVVGNFVSEKGLAAVGTTAPLTIFFMWGLSGLSMGANVLISRMVGEGKDEQIPKAVFNALLIGAVAGFLISLTGVLLAAYPLQWLLTPLDIFNDSLSYLRIYFGCGVAIGIFDFGTAVLRANGDSRHPTYYLGISGLINVGLNLLFTVVFKAGVKGVGWATVIAQYFAAFLILQRLFREKAVLALRLKPEYFDHDLIIQILRYGIPSALQNQLFAFSNMIIMSSINSFGSDLVAANTAANAIEEYVYVFVDAFPQASLTFTSQLYGARKISRIKDLMFSCQLIGGAGAFLLGLLIVANGKTLLGFMSSEPLIIEYGMYRLRYVTLFLFLNGLLDVVVNSLRGMGLANLPTIITMFGVCGFRILYIYTVFARIHTIASLYCCFPLSWLLTLSIQFCIWVAVYRHNRELYA